MQFCGGEVSSFSFRGGPVLTLDQKWRLTVPAKYKDVLMSTVDGKLVIAKNPDGCLSMYPLPVWEAFEAELRAMPLEQAPWKRLYIGSATDVEIDASSRVLIPYELRDWAGLDKEVKCMGVGSYFELWDNARYVAREAALLEGERPEALRKLVF
jgi:MraZ protein